MRVVIPHTFGSFDYWCPPLTITQAKRFHPSDEKCGEKFLVRNEGHAYFSLAECPSRHLLLPQSTCLDLITSVSQRRTCQREDMCNNRCDKRAEFALSTPDFADKRNVCRIDRRGLALTTEAKTAIKFARYSVTTLPESLGDLTPAVPRPKRWQLDAISCYVMSRRLEILTSKPNHPNDLFLLVNRENSKKSLALRARRPEDRRATGSLSYIHM